MVIPRPYELVAAPIYVAPGSGESEMRAATATLAFRMGLGDYPEEAVYEMLNTAAREAPTRVMDIAVPLDPAPRNGVKPGWGEGQRELCGVRFEYEGRTYRASVLPA